MNAQEILNFICDHALKFAWHLDSEDGDESGMYLNAFSANRGGHWFSSSVSEDTPENRRAATVEVVTAMRDALTERDSFTQPPQPIDDFSM